MKKQFDYIVYIGRFQPPTNAHISTVKKALDLSENVLVLLGSSFQPRTIKNPWTDIERSSMILNQISPEYHNRLSFKPLQDHRYNDQEWIQEVQQIVKKHTNSDVTNCKIGIIGHKKDNSSEYLDFFPQWKLIPTDKIDDVNATDVRNDYFNGTLFNWKDKDLISPELQKYLKYWTNTTTYFTLKEEFEFNQKYRKQWENTPYPVIFQTVDSVVIQSGHVLLVQRKENPGANTWALPGGFIAPHERLFDAAIRELKEETKIKVPVPVLKGSCIGQRTFDDPNRSLRGRTITTAFVFQLAPGELIKIKGSDDAKYAKWIPISTALDMEEVLFEDHHSILQYAIGICK